MAKIIPVVIALIHKNNTFLLTERKGNDPDDRMFGRVWHFPGGAIEFGEEVQDALKREIKEELNLTIRIEKQISQVYSAIRTNWQGLLIPHLCVIEGDENIVLDSESFQYGWFTYEEIKNMYVLPFVFEMLEDAMKLLKKG